MLVASKHKALCSLVFVLQILITPKLLFVEGGRKTACSSVPHLPQFLYFMPKEIYTNTDNRSAFGGIQCMGIRVPAALNFLKLRTLILG